MIKVLFFNENKYPVEEKFVKKITAVASGHEKKICGIVEIALVDNKDICKLNRIWRGKNSATDVLSFAWSEEKSIKAPMLGQIFVSYPKIIKQANENEIPVKEELGRMIVHGLLHISGYGHGSAKQAKKMFALQEKILKHLF
ncbi:MAG: rRNA maturation RNase YbeY [Candidatus Magasanikbacteria bacterium]|nr:rRNA maturation RNase YbeY [Candidatus Magasanikbacteria bacterium]